MAQKMALLRKKVFKNTIQTVIHPDIWEEMYDKVKGQDNFLHYGLSDAVIEIKWECLYLSTNFKTCNLNCYQTINENLKLLMEYYDKTANYTDMSSTWSLQKSYRSLLHFTFLTLIFLFCFLTLYIIPYFRMEQALVRYMQMSRKEQIINGKGSILFDEMKY